MIFLRRDGADYALALAAALLLLAGCSRKEPDTADVEQSISGSVPGYAVKDLKCESFADRNQEAAGRTSCRGTVVLDQELYRTMPPGSLQALLVDAGIPPEGASFFAGRHPQTIYLLNARKGDEGPLLAECSYMGNVDGWQISCDPSYNRFLGEPLGALGDGPVVKDSPEYRTYVERVLTDYRAVDAAYLALKRHVEGFFSSGKTVSVVNRFAGDGPVMRFKLAAPISWSGERGFLGYQSKFRIETKYQDLRSEDRTFCGYGHGTPPDDLLLEGDISGSTRSELEQGGGLFTAHVEIFERTRLFNNGYSGCGNRLPWNGESWGKERGLEIRSP
ncbi:MAG TPA: hypothetical protein VF619_01225 [Allosphingosinicella sp.]|jgi:hypothetical protein